MLPPSPRPFQLSLFLPLLVSAPLTPRCHLPWCLSPHHIHTAQWLGAPGPPTRSRFRYSEKPPCRIGTARASISSWRPASPSALLATVWPLTQSSRLLPLHAIDLLIPTPLHLLLSPSICLSPTGLSLHPIILHTPHALMPTPLIRCAFLLRCLPPFLPLSPPASAETGPHTHSFPAPPTLRGKQASF